MKLIPGTKPSVAQINTVATVVVDQPCFHVHKYGFCTDIEKASLHVSLHKAEILNNFLWLSDHQDPVSKLKIPSLSFQGSHPWFSKITNTNSLAVSEDIQSNLQLYVIFGCHSECEVIQYYNK